MGKSDSLSKIYMNNNAVFADAFNFLIYNGRQVIKPDNLSALDISLFEAPFGAQNPDAGFVQKYRDILKYASFKTDNKNTYVILGMENQNKINYTMPVRNMLYDALQYSSQIRDISKEHRQRGEYKGRSSDEFLSGFYKNDRLIPVITLVVYFGADKWEAPLSLHEMIGPVPDEIMSLVQDYKIHLIEPCALSDEDLKKFKTDFRTVMDFIKSSEDVRRMRALLSEERQLAEISTEAVMLLNSCTKLNIEINKNTEDKNMCGAIQELMDEKFSQGRTEGIEKGRLEEKRLTASKLYKRAMNIDEIADIVEIDRSVVSGWIEEMA